MTEPKKLYANGALEVWEDELGPRVHWNGLQVFQPPAELRISESLILFSRGGDFLVRSAAGWTVQIQDPELKAKLTSMIGELNAHCKKVLSGGLGSGVGCSQSDLNPENKKEITRD